MKHEQLLKKLEEYHQNTDDNIVGVGYGYKTKNGILTDQLSIIFTVKKKISIKQLKSNQILPKEIDIDNDKIITDVVERTFKFFCDESFYLWENPGYTVTNRNNFRPLKGGISFTNFSSLSEYVSTLGFFAKDNETNSIVGVTNNHALLDDGFICSERNNPESTVSNIAYDIATQPNELINYGFQNAIGTVKRYYPLSSVGYNYVDVALTTIYSGTTFIDTGVSFSQEGLTNVTTFLEFATTEEIDNLLVSGTTSYNPLLYSAGRTTGAKGEGVTKLLVYEFPVIVSVDYNKQSISGVTVDFSDLIAFVATTGTTQPIEFICDYPIAGGDSGSALIADISGTLKIIGLCFAGSTDVGLACRIDHVANLMNISAWNGETINFSDTSNIMEYTINGLSDQIYIDHEEKRYWQVGLKNI